MGMDPGCGATYLGLVPLNHLGETAYAEFIRAPLDNQLMLLGVPGNYDFSTGDTNQLCASIEELKKFHGSRTIRQRTPSFADPGDAVTYVTDRSRHVARISSDGLGLDCIATVDQSRLHKGQIRIAGYTSNRLRQNRGGLRAHKSAVRHDYWLDWLETFVRNAAIYLSEDKLISSPAMQVLRDLCLENGFTLSRPKIVTTEPLVLGSHDSTNFRPHRVSITGDIDKLLSILSKGRK
jgi:hypothetical protein